MACCRVTLLVLLSFVSSETTALTVQGAGVSVDIVNETPGSVVSFVSEDVGYVSFEITAFEDASVRMYTQNTLSSATPGQDFLPIDDTFNLTRSASIVVTVNITDDDFVESHEYVGVGFESDVTLNSSQYFLFIEDNDRLSVAFEQEVYTTTESRAANICAIIVAGSIERPQPVSLTLTSSPNSASPFEDYIPIQPEMSFVTGGPNIVCASIATVMDPENTPIVEDVESYVVSFELNAEIDIVSPSNATVYIMDENGADVSVFNPSSSSPFSGEFLFNESNTDVSVEVYVRVNPLSNATVTLQRNVEVLLSTSIGSADDTDFIGVSNSLLTIPNGSLMASFNITIRGDILPESDEQFTFNISTVNPSDRVVSPSQGVVTILNDDEVPDCGVPPSPGVNGQVDFNSTIHLTEAVYSCDQGYELVGGNVTRICLLIGMWSGPDPVCQIIDCGNLTSPFRGYVSITETTFGSVANYSCSEGYEVNGNTSRTCLDSGVWSGTEPLCSAVDCDDLLAPPYGNLSLNSTDFLSMAVYSCVFGYNLMGNSSRSCRANGVWSGEEPTCEAVDCGTLDPPVFGGVNINETRFGSNATYDCQRGYMLNGTSVRVCGGDGQWSDSAPQCTPFDCGELLSPFNGQVSTNGTVYPTGYAFYECDTEFNLVGSMDRFCLFNGWSGQEPICEAVDCGMLDAPMFGDINFNETTFGSNATYTCQRGYTLNGTSVRVCGGDGQWSDSAPQCTPVDCGMLDPPMFGDVNFNETTFGSNATYTCQRGYLLNSTSVRVCGGDGQWSDSAPQCTPFDCSELLSPFNGQVTTNGTVYPIGYAFYECDNGFNLVGPMDRFCLFNGWSGQEPICEAVRCGSLPDPQNGRVSFSNPPAFETLANYSCNEGFIILGSSISRICQANSLWSGTPPECIPVDCGNLMDPINGTVTLSSTTFQSIAEYSCDLGFEVSNGPATRVCQSNGTWSDSQPSCQVVDCGQLDNPVNGFVETLLSTTFGSIVEYGCNFGFLPIGNLVRTCQSNGQWSGSEPTCVPSDSSVVGGNRNANGNSEFVVIIVCTSVGGFALAVIITVIVIAVAIVRSRRNRRESYSFTISAHRSRAQRSSEIVSESHSGIFIPMSGLNHPLYDSVFANTASTTEYQDFPVYDERTLDTQSNRSNHSSINCTPIDVALSGPMDNLSISDTASGTLRAQADLMEAILFNDPMTSDSESGDHYQMPYPQVMYDSDSSYEGQGVELTASNDVVYDNKDAFETEEGMARENHTYDVVQEIDDSVNSDDGTSSVIYNNRFTN